MICPYCGTRNIRSSVVCTQCGAILRDSHTVKANSQKKASQTLAIRKRTNGILFIVVGATVAATIGFFLGRFMGEKSRVLPYFIMAGAVVGAAIMAVVSFGGLTIRRYLNSISLKQLRSKTSKLISEAEALFDDDIKKENNAESRYKLAALYLMANDLDKSLHQFEQATNLQSPQKPEDLNNIAIAFAMRGQLGQAYDRLERAVSIAPNLIEPLFNFSRVLNFTGRDTDAKRAEQKLTANSVLTKKSAELQNQLGLSYVIEGKTKEAISSFEQAGKLTPNAKDRVQTLNVRNNIAVAKATAGQAADAQAELNAILKLEPDNARALANLGVLLISQGKYPQAIDRLNSAIHLDKSLALAHCDLGYAYCMSNSVNEGIREFRAAVLLESNIFEGQYDLGKAYLDEGIVDVAEKSLARALQLRRTSWHVHQAIGVLHYQNGQIEKAIVSFQEALSLSPHQPVALSALAVCHVKLNSYDIARQELDEAWEFHPRNAEVLANLSWLNILLDKPNEASDYAKLSVTADDALAQSHNNLGLSQLALGAPGVAMEAFKKALATNPTLTKIHYHLGNTHAALKQTDSAIREWNLATQAEPGNGNIYTNLGVAYYLTAKIEQAIAEFKRVLRIRTDRLEDYVNLGLALAAGKYHKEAIDQFDRALAINPRHTAVHSNRGLACYFSNNVEEALREWQLVSKLDPAYAKRRGKKQESEYDDTIIEYAQLEVPERAMYIEPHTAEFLYRFLPGYDTDKWLIIPPHESLEELPGLLVQQQKLERQSMALEIT